MQVLGVTLGKMITANSLLPLALQVSTNPDLAQRGEFQVGVPSGRARWACQVGICWAGRGSGHTKLLQ